MAGAAEIVFGIESNQSILVPRGQTVTGLALNSAPEQLYAIVNVGADLVTRLSAAGVDTHADRMTPVVIESRRVVGVFGKFGYVRSRAFGMADEAGLRGTQPAQDAEVGMINSGSGSMTR